MKDNKKKDIKYIEPTEGEKKPWSLLALGVLCVILGLLSVTGVIPSGNTIFSVSIDFMVVVGLIAIILGLILRKKNL